MRFFTLFFVLSFIYYFHTTVSGQIWTETQKVIASDRQPIDFFGQTVAISDSFAIVGAFQQDYNALGLDSINGAGAAYIFQKNSTGQWVEQQKLVAQDRAAYDNFGRSVAITEDYAIVGAELHDYDANGVDSLQEAGAVYVFKRAINGQWISSQKLVASDRAAGDNFGQKIALYGRYLVVSSMSSSDALGGNIMNDAGACYVFKQTTCGQWIEVQKIVPLDRDPYDRFGHAISIDNNRILVSAIGETMNSFQADSLFGCGAVYVFEKNGQGQWAQQQKIVASDRASSTYFGNAIAISSNYLLVSTPYESQNSAGNNYKPYAGAAYIFERDSLTQYWVQQQKITASDRTEDDFFGWSAALDGNIAVLGAFYENDDPNNQQPIALAGSAYIFERDSLGQWAQEQKIVASDRGISGLFGSAVAIKNQQILVGAWLEPKGIDSSDSSLEDAGAAYFFHYSLIDAVPYIPSTEGIDINIYPNPFSEKITIDLSQKTTKTRVLIYSLTGQLIQQVVFHNQQLLSLNLNLPKGIYSLVIDSADIPTSISTNLIKQ